MPTRFEPEIDHPRYKELMAKARATNKQRDRDEREIGFRTPSDGGLSEQLRTAISALSCGIAVDDWDAVAEGLDMLIATEATLRSLTSHG